MNKLLFKTRFRVIRIMTFMEEELFKNDHMHFDCFNFYCTYSYVCVNSHTNNHDLIYHSNAGILKNSIRHSSP